MIHSCNKVKKLETSLVMAKSFFMVYVHFLYIDTLFFIFFWHEKHYTINHKTFKEMKLVNNVCCSLFTYLENE